MHHSTAAVYIIIRPTHANVKEEALQLHAVYEPSRSAFQSSKPIGQYIIHIYTRICVVALTTP